jgi:polyhydroxyalkanoate synthesis regulator phasin
MEVQMVEFFKKSLFTAVGLAAMTREKIEEVGKKLAEEAKLSEIEGKQFVEDLIKKSDETRFALEKMVYDTVNAALKKLDIPTRSEITSIENRVQKIETKMTEQEKG